MKIAFKHLSKKILSDVSINDLSKKLFQLGHEHEVEDDVFNMEFTPNRGDCLSLNGLLRELKLFYEIKNDNKIYDKTIDSFNINFTNNAIKDCSKISFLKVEIEKIPTSYLGNLKEYCDDLAVNKNNFFTDISNFISYETGQPTHCYDSSKIFGNNITLDYNSETSIFHTLLKKKIKLNPGNLVFFNNQKIINLAGIVGSQETACSTSTKSVIIECASFHPESILGKSIRYDIKSDAAHKFERGVDPLCHEHVLKRFLAVIEEHVPIKNAQIYEKSYQDFQFKKIKYEPDEYCKVIGINLDENHIKKYLNELGFSINDNYIIAPSYRSDINSRNDIAEEIARAVGFDNIQQRELNLPKRKNHPTKTSENRIKNILIKNGFNEVINFPFNETSPHGSIKIDNPLDSTRNFLRISLKDGLIKNLLFNERRQKDSVKLFEVSDIYYIDNNKIKNKKRIIGIIASGRVGKNYLDFSKKITNQYISSLFKDDFEIEFSNISRENLNSKLKNHISYSEFEIVENTDKYTHKSEDTDSHEQVQMNCYKYKPVSDYPSSIRDLSISIKDPKNYKPLENTILNFEHELLKELYIFDFYNNKKNNEIKIGFRFIFQSMDSTITDNQVNEVMKVIINQVMTFKNVSIPGLVK
jgi:phenylalanyl-tRNA synthetase beta chain